MRETEKSRIVRDAEFFAQFFAGRVIDIGAGNCPVVPDAEIFDLAEGDANQILSERSPETYDTVYSSHCLEHMKDVPTALAEWWQLIRPGGYLVLIVPDEDLYEQGFWPSIFNHDHKATFRYEGNESWSPVSINVVDLVLSLPGSEIVSAKRQDCNYRREFLLRGGKDRPLLRKKIGKGIRILHKLSLSGSLLERMLFATSRFYACPIDQTLGNALAQIEVIARKHTASVSRRTDGPGSAAEYILTVSRA